MCRVVRWRRVAVPPVEGGLAALVGDATGFYLAYLNAGVVAWVPGLLAPARSRATFPCGAAIVD